MILLHPIPSGHRTPALPVAKYITLARIATPWSVDKRYEDRFTRGLRSHFEREQGVGSRLIKQGDVVAVPISEEIKENDDDEEDRLSR
jgi:peroxin-6